MSRVVIAGATGFIGQNLTSSLLETGSTVVVLSRNASGANMRIHPLLSVDQWDGKTQGAWTRHIDGADVVINLAGQSLGTKRWTGARRQELLLSRTQPTHALVEAIRAAKTKPPVLINASAVGYYGHVEAGEVTENFPPGKDFLGRMCAEWESAAIAARELGVRVVLLRTGVVLDKSAGALQRMLLPFRLFAGGPLGTGTQWFPWIHRQDVIRAIQFALQTRNLSGPINLVAPEQATMQDFSKTLGQVLRRPSLLRVPPFVLKMILGDMADIVLTGQKVVPQKLNQAGFEFHFPTLAGALENLLKQPRKKS